MPAYGAKAGELAVKCVQRRAASFCNVRQVLMRNIRPRRFKSGNAREVSPLFF